MEELMLMTALFSPIVLARPGIVCQRTWFHLARTFLLLTALCFVGTVTAATWMLESFGRHGTMKLFSAGVGLAGLLFLGCLLAGIFYREAFHEKG